MAFGTFMGTGLHASSSGHHLGGFLKSGIVTPDLPSECLHINLLVEKYGHSTQLSILIIFMYYPLMHLLVFDLDTPIFLI